MRNRGLHTLLLAAGFLAWSAAAEPASAVTPGVSTLLPRVGVGRCLGLERFVFAAHGGAIFTRNGHPNKIAFLDELLPEVRKKLEAGARALDVVHAAVVAMEDSGVFNAGRGAIANRDGRVEMDASIMDGRTRAAGAVAAIETLKNPVNAARVVMERSPHVMMVGDDAEAYISAHGGTAVDSSYFLHSGRNFSNVPLPEDLEIQPPGPSVHDERAGFSGIWSGVWRGQLNHVFAVERIGADGAQIVYANGINEYWGIDEAFWVRLTAPFVGDELRFTRTADSGAWTLTYRWLGDDRVHGTAVRQGDGLILDLDLHRWTPPDPLARGGTVGAVALDRCGHLAAATSTGGFGSKTPGRVGDSPIIGAGTYADNRTAAISATGHGESFMRHVAAYDIAARLRYKRISLERAAREVIEGSTLRGGVIAVDADGNLVMPFNTVGMVRGSVSNLGKPVVALY